MSDGVRLTLPASFWCMLTTLLGFASLFLASAKPLHELGRAGVIGTAVAIAVAYALFPPFLRRAELDSSSEISRQAAGTAVLGLAQRRATPSLGVFAVLVAFSAIGVPRLDTDPSLLSYFAVDTPIRVGLESVDRDGGSSPLYVVVQDTAGQRIDSDEVVDRIEALQQDLEGDSSVGTVVSPALLLAEAHRAPLVGRMPHRMLLDLLARTPFQATIASYVHSEREQGLLYLRMHESGREDPRQTIVDRITNLVRDHGLDPVLVGGLFQLQGELGELIASSLRLGLGGLTALFLVIAFVVSRDKQVTAAMVLCLAGIPLVVLGTFGHVGTPIDIISSPAANVALAMGVDSMIHLMMRARLFRSLGKGRWDAWVAAQGELWRPVVGAALIISAGFGIFGLSTFPPTRTFGLAVILGTVVAAATALLVLPYGAAGRVRR